MDLLPYLKDFGGVGGTIIFFALFMRSEMKRDSVTQKLIDLLPIVTTAMNASKTSIDSAAELMREKARIDARKSP